MESTIFLWRHLFHNMNVHRSFPWIFQSFDIPNFSSFLRMIFKKFNLSRYIQSRVFSILQFFFFFYVKKFLKRDNFALKRWLSDIVWIDKGGNLFIYRFDSNRIRKFGCVKYQKYKKFYINSYLWNQFKKDKEY